MFILLVGVLATTQIIDASPTRDDAQPQRDGATNVARELVEAARGVPYEKVSEPGVTTALQAIPGLQDTDGAGYMIRRDGVDYTVVVDVCIMDDAKDGGGSRPSSATFCSNSVAAGNGRQEPRGLQARHGHHDLDGAGPDAHVVQSGVVNNPGTASGPAIRTLVPRGYAAGRTWSRPTQRGHLRRHDLLAAGHRRLAARRHASDGPGDENGRTGLAWKFDLDHGDRTSTASTSSPPRPSARASPGRAARRRSCSTAASRSPRSR